MGSRERPLRRLGRLSTSRMISPQARRSRCERRTSGVRRSKKLPADQNQLMEAVKDNRSLFVCLFRAMKPNQTTSICLLRAIKAPTNQLLFVCLLRAHKLAQFKVAATPPYSKSQSKTSFFVLRPASWLEVTTYLLCAPYCLPSPLRLFSGGMILSFFLLFNNPPFDLHCAPQCKRHWIL